MVDAFRITPKDCFCARAHNFFVLRARVAGSVPLPVVCIGHSLLNDFKQRERLEIQGKNNSFGVSLIDVYLKRRLMNRTLLAVTALTSILAVSVAQASDGTLNFTGALTAPTCTSSVNGVANVTSIALPRVAASSLAFAGTIAGATNFTIELSNCDDSIATAAVNFEAGPGVDPTTFNIRNTATAGAATNVQLRLRNAAGNTLRAGSATQTNNARTPLTDGAAVLRYSVEYFASAAATAGAVVGSVTYAINYQ
ncbi:fimbrial protein [Pseudomonas fluorescens]|nr:fimbrial protein [Pseudomonas fluorescens]